MDGIHSQDTGARREVMMEEDKEWVLLSRCEHDWRQKIEEPEAVECGRRCAAEEERYRIENEGGRRIEEDRRLAQLRNRAAVCIQRHVRGGLIRIKWYRHLLENQRAAWEHERELASEQERIESRMMDQQRIADERAWVQYLNSVDHLKRMKVFESQRALKKVLQKTRILIRELQRHEDNQRLKIEIEESDSRFICTTNCQLLTARMQKNERGRRRCVEQHQARHHTITSKPQMIQQERKKPQQREMKTLAERSTRADMHVKEALTEYALSRARLHDNQHEGQRLMPVGTRQSSALDSTSAEKSLFSKVQRSWLKQQEFMEPALVPSIQQGSRSMTMIVDDDLYNGPYRVIEASMQSMSSMPHLPPPPSSLIANTAERTHNIKQMPQWTPSSKGTIDWDHAFDS